MKLEEFRVKKGFNYEELSLFLKIGRSTTYNICKERIACVSLKNAHQIVSKTHGKVDYPELLWGDC